MLSLAELDYTARTRRAGALVIEIDETAGVCPGVRRAIRTAEEEAQAGETIAIIGELLHNRREMERLQRLGLRVVEQEKLAEAERPERIAPYRRLLVRTHGLPASLREKLERAGFELVDGTCPVVRRSQRMIRTYAERGYQVLVVGKPKHPEVLALVGQAPGAARAVMEPEDVGELDPVRPVFVLAQTTIDQKRFERVLEEIRAKHPRVEVRNTICRAVAGRHEVLKEFAARQDVVFFVGGKNSSNTRQLFGVCSSVNPRTYWIESADEIDPSWLRGVRRVGISGSASTPHWQLEEVARYIQIKAQQLGESKEVTSNG